jgi:AcrR family transcriptional regulator
MDMKIDGSAPQKVKRTLRSERRADHSVVPRERILHAAARLFREHGYKGTTVRDIAEAVGILSGSLFHHFQSKEEMLLEIMREAALSVCIRAEEITERPGAPADQLRQLVELELESIVGDIRKDYHVVLFFEWRDVPEAAKPELTRLRKRYQRSWAQVLEACHANGQLRCPPDVAQLILHGALRGTMTWFRPTGRYSTDEFGDILTGLVLQ